MKITDFLKMVLRQFTKSDKEVLFADWRQELNDNFEKIDTNAQEVNTILESKLEVTNIIEGTNVTLHKDGNNITISATGDVSEQDVIDKIQEHNISSTAHADLREKCDVIETTGTGKRFLANDGTYKEIVGGGGGTVFDVEEYEVFTATTQTDTFTITDMSENKIVQLVKDGLELIKDVNYTLDKSTGIVTLGFALEQGESVYYKVLYGANNAVIYDEDEIIEGSAVFDADTLQGHGIDYFATSEGLGNKVDKSQIKNTLTETETGNVLDATQGKVLNDKVSVLQDSPNFTGTPTVQGKQVVTSDVTTALSDKINVLTNFNKILDSGTDVFTFASNNNFGLYQANPNTVTNLPSFSSTEISFVRIINKHLIECTDLYSTKIYRSTKVNNIWQPWQQIATTTTWQCAVSNLANGYKSVADTPAYFTRNGNLVTVNNMILLTTTAVITQNTIFLQNIPVEFRPSITRGVVLKGSNGKLYNAGVMPSGVIYCDNSISIWETNLSLDCSFSYNL